VAVIKTDTFTEGGNTALESHTSDSGGGWSGLQTTQFDVIAADDEVELDRDNLDFALGDETPANADYWCNVNCRTVGTSNGNRPASVVRLAAGINGYYMEISGSGAWRLKKIVAGSVTVLDSGTVAAELGSFSESTFYDVKVEAQSSTIKGYLNDNEVASVTDSDVSATGSVGISMRNGTTERITSLTSEDFVTVTVPDDTLAPTMQLANSGGMVGAVNV
jgi:hypothetical protein